MRFQGNQLALLLRGKRVRAGIDKAFFNALQKTGDPDLKKLIQIAGGDGEELYSLQQGIVFVIGFFQHAPVKGKP